MGLNCALTGESRILLVPFELHRRFKRVYVRLPHAQEWIVLDEFGATALTWLDEGLNLSEARARAIAEWKTPLDTESFAASLIEMGAAKPLCSGQQHHSHQLPVKEAGRQYRATWWSFASIALLGIAYILILGVQAGRLPLTGHALIPEALSLSTGILLLISATIVTVVLHESAHAIIGHAYGLKPKFALNTRGLWVVIETRLRDLWSLAPRYQWRPVVAGLMSDVVVLSAALAFWDASGRDGIGGSIALMLAAVSACHILWQFQWFMRTDVYYLMNVLSGSLSLRYDARQVLLDISRRFHGDMDPPSDDVRAGKLYLLTLPVAFTFTAVLWGCFILPGALQFIQRLG